MLITVKTLLIFSIFFMLTLLRLATEEETPVVNHRVSFYLKVNYAESIYVSVTSLESRTLTGSFGVRKCSVSCSIPVTVLKSIRDYTSSLKHI